MEMTRLNFDDQLSRKRMSGLPRIEMKMRAVVTSMLSSRQKLVGYEMVRSGEFV